MSVPELCSRLRLHEVIVTMWRSRAGDASAHTNTSLATRLVHSVVCPQVVHARVLHVKLPQQSVEVVVAGEWYPLHGVRRDEFVGLCIHFLPSGRQGTIHANRVSLHLDQATSIVVEACMSVRPPAEQSVNGLQVPLLRKHETAQPRVLSLGLFSPLLLPRGNRLPHSASAR
jgi:hypothetical protein